MQTHSLTTFSRSTLRKAGLPGMSLMGLLLLPALAAAAPVATTIKVDNFGYRATAAKLAVFTTDPGTTLEVRNTSDQVVYTIPNATHTSDQIVYRPAHVLSSDGGVSYESDGGIMYDHSGAEVWQVTFSGFTTPGTYRLYSPTLGEQSYDFTIGNDVYVAPVRQAMKTFYYQRCNTGKTATHAGDWADATACHTSDATMRPLTGHVDHGTLDLSGGWHDAGDYNKYVWRDTALAVYFLLRAYEDNPSAFPDDSLHIEAAAGNTTPDILDELKWELDWMKKMQLTSTTAAYEGAVLSRIQQPDRTLFESPPSADTTVRYYYDVNHESAAVLAGSFAYASRIYATVPAYATYAGDLKTAANKAWDWLKNQSEPADVNVKNLKVWAAAEIFRLNTGSTLQEEINRAANADTYVKGFYGNSWAGRSFHNPRGFDTLAAFTYYATSGADTTTRTNMKAALDDGVATILHWEKDNYDNGMLSYHYDWGSNGARAAHGVFLQIAAKLGTFPSWTSAATLQKRSEEFLHYMHGRNPLSMVYLTNMASLGGEHSTWQLYHGWFGAAGKTHSMDNYIGKPSSVVESAYPYYALTDNHGVNDNKSSLYGPAPGFIPGGPNPHYPDSSLNSPLTDCSTTGGTASPPIDGVVYRGVYNKYYRDWNDTTWDATAGHRACSWRLNENSISYQAPYVALGSYFMQ